MMSYLPLGIHQLLDGAVENARIEFKASWDSETTGHQILKTLCAFANDLQNLNGGYVLLGVGEQNGGAVRPVRGLEDAELDAAQKWVRGNCQRIEPTYMPVMDVAQVDGRRVLVLWAPASDVRPHQAPDGPKGERKFWVRVGSESVVAKDEILTTLMQQTARVPFDDRRAMGASNEDLSSTLVREFLKDVGSELLGETSSERVYRCMQIVAPVNGHTVPKNIGLLLFSDDPGRWFRGARIEVVEFLDDAGGNVQVERVFSGPLQSQVRQCLSYVESMTTRHLEKSSASAQTRGWVSFPSLALREAVVNAVYHRSYEVCIEPVKVYFYPNRVEIISYPGPVSGIEERHLQANASPPPVPARNRRVGEFLKELRLAEGRGTGLPKIRRSMAENGSPAPRFDFDGARSYFRVVLPAHPEYVTLTLLREYAYQRATGELGRARRLLAQAWSEGSRSPSLLMAMVRDGAEQGELSEVDRAVDALQAQELEHHAGAVLALGAAHADAGNEGRSEELLNRLSAWVAGQHALDAAILERRLGRQERAHRMFERAGEAVLRDARALHEFAQAKLRLTGPLSRSKRAADREARERLLKEAAAYLERVLQLDAPPARHAWAWFNLGQARQWLGAPRQDAVAAYERAVALDPEEPRFLRALERAKGADRA